jgi:hypothetical protein
MVIHLLYSYDRSIRLFAHQVTVERLEEQGGRQPLEAVDGRDGVQVQQQRQDDEQEGSDLNRVVDA